MRYRVRGHALDPFAVAHVALATLEAWHLPCRRIERSLVDIARVDVVAGGEKGGDDLTADTGRSCCSQTLRIMPSMLI